MHLIMCLLKLVILVLISEISCYNYAIMVHIFLFWVTPRREKKMECPYGEKGKVNRYHI